MNLASVIASLATGTYTVTRKAAATVTSGKATAGATSTITITASIQPARGRELASLPEGLRTSEAIAIWTATELRTATAPGGTYPDTIAYRGSTYEVQILEPWSEAGNYYKAVATKVGQ